HPPTRSPRWPSAGCHRPPAPLTARPAPPRRQAPRTTLSEHLHFAASHFSPSSLRYRCMPLREIRHESGSGARSSGEVGLRLARGGSTAVLLAGTLATG